jgi:G:T/U-mismatch repair DNA glycosylase
MPELRAVAFNGAKSAEMGRRALAGTALELIALPSSSPAYTLALKAKLAAWMELRRLLT